MALIFKKNNGSDMKIRKAVFPVAGLGTRFLPATKAMAKEMLPVVDKPIIQYAVEEAFAAGIEQIIFVTGRGKKALEDHFDRSFELETNLQKKGKTTVLEQLQALVPPTGTIVYTRQHEPRGLGHAIWCARDIVGDEPFAVLLADDLIKSRVPVLSQMINRFDRYRATIAAVMDVPKEQTHRYGILDAEEMEDNVVRVNGTAQLTADDDITTEFSHDNKTPKTVIVITAQELYFQCAKALMRSELWFAENESHRVPTAGQLIHEVDEGFDSGSYDAGYAEYAKKKMW